MAEESEKTSLKQLLQGMNTPAVQFLQGTVISASPLKIQMVNDENLIIGPNITIVPWQLTDYETELTPIEWFTDASSGGSGEAAYASHSHSITGRKKVIIHNSLKVGDKVHVLAFNNGKQYFVLDRVRKDA